MSAGEQVKPLPGGIERIELPQFVLRGSQRSLSLRDREPQCLQLSRPLATNAIDDERHTDVLAEIPLELRIGEVAETDHLPRLHGGVSLAELRADATDDLVHGLVRVRTDEHSPACIERSPHDLAQREALPATRRPPDERQRLFECTPSCLDLRASQR